MRERCGLLPPFLFLNLTSSHGLPRGRLFFCPLIQLLTSDCGEEKVPQMETDVCFLHFAFYQMETIGVWKAFALSEMRSSSNCSNLI